MAKDHPVTTGDHLLRIAEAEQFRDFHAIWDDAANDALKRRRFNPNVLDSGDVVTVPDRVPFETLRDSDQVHRLVVKRPRSILNVRLESAGFKPRADRALEGTVTVTSAGKVTKLPPLPGKTKADGTETIRSAAPFVEVELHLLPGTKPTETEERIQLLVGQLAPLGTRKGQQARLNNLGYFAGFQESDLEQLRWAVEEFQTDHRREFPRMKRLGLEPDGSIDKETMIALGTVHGDLLPGQESSL